MSRGIPARRAAPGPLPLLLLLVAGCREDGPPTLPLHPAGGTVKVDGRPAGGVEVRLHPEARIVDLDAPRPFATTGDDGRFELGTYRKGDGAPAGRYKVTLFWPDRPLGPELAGDQLGDRYSDPRRTDLGATVAPGMNAFEYDVRKPERPARPARPPRKARPAQPDVDGVG